MNGGKSPIPGPAPATSATPPPPTIFPFLFCKSLSLSFQHKLSWLQSTQQKRQKLGLRKLENAVVIAKLFTDCIYKGGWRPRDDISIDTRIPFTTQVSREHLLLQKTLSSRPDTK